MARLGGLREAIARRGVGSFLITNLVNIRYLTGFHGTAGLLLVGERECDLLVDPRYIGKARDTVFEGVNVVGIDRGTGLRKAAAKLIRKRRVREVGYEPEFLHVQDLMLFRGRCPWLMMRPMKDLVREIRVVKDDEELVLLKKAAALGDRLFAELRALGSLVGRTENEMARWFHHRAVDSGAEEIAFETIVAAGDHAAQPHAEPTDRRIAEGEVVVLDFGVRIEGYHSDMTRTLFAGQVDDRGRELYELVLRAQVAGLEMVRPGVGGSEVDDAARQVIAQAGYGDYFTHGLGHGVGLDIHEFPYLAESSRDVLAPGMVVTVEPGVYLPEWGGVRIEDLVVVTEDGCELLSGAPKELTVA